MSKEAKRVAITARLSVGDGDPRVAAANAIFDDVVELIRSNGMEPVIIRDAVIPDDIVGIVLPGGGDIDPALYAGEPCDALYDVNPEQDALDLAVARFAIEQQLPVLGICRGAQILNVAQGGTLYADLAPSDVNHYHVPEEGEELKFLWHDVALEPSQLRDALGAPTISVATGHHQGIDRIGGGLRITARADDGLPEAFEDETGRILGVQWHPEAPDTPAAEQNAPFLALARALEREASNV